MKILNLIQPTLYDILTEQQHGVHAAPSGNWFNANTGKVLYADHDSYGGATHVETIISNFKEFGFDSDDDAAASVEDAQYATIYDRGWIRWYFFRSQGALLFTSTRNNFKTTKGQQLMRRISKFGNVQEIVISDLYNTNKRTYYTPAFTYPINVKRLQDDGEFIDIQTDQPVQF